MNLHCFKQLYNLELPPLGATQIHLGDLVWKAPLRRPNWLENGLPKNVYSCIHHFNQVDNAEMLKGIKHLHSQRPKPWGLVRKVVTTNRRYSKRFPHPIALKINNKLPQSLQHTYFFSGLEKKAIHHKERKNIALRLHPINDKVQHLYSGFPSLYLVTEVHYGALNFCLREEETSPAHQFIEKEMKSGKMECYNSVKKEKTYRFGHNNVPFAVRLENINNFKACMEYPQ